MKKRFWIATLILMVVMLVGCSSPQEESPETISPEMTGFDDFYQGMWDGDPYCIVYGSQGSEQDTIRLKNFAERIQALLQNQMAVTIPVKSDEELTEDAKKESHLILIGNPETNLTIAAVNDQLPIRVVDGNLEVPDAGWTIGEETATFTYLIPNPLNRSKYLWVFGATSAEYFSHLRYMTMNSKTEEYLIKADERTRYSGKFSKSSTAWTIPTLEARETIGDFESVKSEQEHFILRYSPVDQLTKERMGEIIESRESCYTELANRLGFEPDRVIEIDIYQTQGIMEHYVGWDDDTLNGVIYEVHKQGEEDPAYKEKIAKVFVGTIGVPLDQMTLEGVAVSLAAEENADEVVRSIADTEQYVPLRAMLGAMVDRSLDPAVVQAELQSFFGYLERSYGIDKVIALYEANETMELEAAIQEVLEKDLFVLEGEWLVEITQ